MASLKDILTKPENRRQVVADTQIVIDEEVASKGLMGLPIKAAYALVKAVKPGFIAEVVDNLLDDFSAALDPLYQEAVAQGQPVDGYFSARGGPVAEALLGITDARAQRAKNQGVKTAYEKLRPTAKKHVESAVPRMGRLIAKHTRGA